MRRARAAHAFRPAGACACFAATLALVSIARRAEPAGLGAPEWSARGTLVWNRAPAPLRDPLPVPHRAVPGGAATHADSLAMWTAEAARGTVWAPVALRVLARAAAESGAVARADSLWAALAHDSPWSEPEALAARVDLALAASDSARAESLLAAARVADWPEADQAVWLARRAALRRARGATPEARRLAREAMVRFPASAAAAQALTILAQVTGPHRAATLEEERAAAEVEALHGQRAAAAARLAHAQRMAPSGERWRIALRRGAILRADRRFAESRAALTQAAAGAGPEERPRVVLEMARTLVAADNAHDARRWLERAAAAADTGVASAARWELGRLEESRGDWSAASRAFGGLAHEGGARATEAAFRAGLAALAEGQRDSARTWFERGVGEGAHFWQAVLLRSRALMVADTTLRAIAAGPGYTFYRVAARDSLGIAHAPASAVAQPDTLAGSLEQASAWVAGHDDDEAEALLEAWASRDSRLGGHALRPPERWLGAASVAYAAGVNALGIRLSARALEATRDPTEAARVAPWLYPPAFARERARADSATRGVMDPALLAAVVWQESRFDPRARSRSDALGLLQLKVGTAGDVARARGEAAPDAEGLLDPERNLRLGATYLAGLIERSGGDVVRGLAAYNAGPSVAARWVSLRDRGGVALDCELIARPETQDYVKKIRAAREAYRELAPAEGSR